MCVDNARAVLSRSYRKRKIHSPGLKSQETRMKIKKYQFMLRALFQTLFFSIAIVSLERDGTSLEGEKKCFSPQ